MRLDATAREDEGTVERELREILDEGLATLGGREREALLLRYFAQQTAVESAATAGASAAAMEKRIERGVEKLRRYFSRRGYAIGGAVVARALAVEGAEGVPAGLAGKVGVVGGLKSGVAVGMAKGVVEAFLRAKLKIVLVIATGALVVAGACVVLVMALPMRLVAVAPRPISTVQNPQPVVTSLPVGVSKGELLAMAEKRAAGVKDLAVEYDYVPIVTSTDSIGFHYKVAIKGEKIYVDKAHGIGLDTSQFRDVSTFDGEWWMYLQGFNSMGLIQKEPVNKIRLRDMGWFELEMIGSPRDTDQGRFDETLVSLLRMRDSVVHPMLEAVDGHACVVVDELNGGRLYRTVWLDQAQGLLPLRMTYWRKGEEELIFRTLDVVEVGGLWCPTLAERRVLLAAGLGKEIVMRMEVRGRGTKKLGLRVNQGIGDEVFDLSKNWPPGTSVSEEASKRIYDSGGVKWTGERSDFDPGLPGE